MEIFLLKLDLATLYPYVRFYQTHYLVGQLSNDRIIFESNKLLTDNFWTLAMIDSANCNILHPCLPAEGIRLFRPSWSFLSRLN
jgi:hypothetical protein